jgi:response regulator NasT
VDGLKKSRFKPIIDVAIAHFKEHQSLREELVRTRATLEERKLVDRAKGLVMQRRKCTESEAYEMMRGIAMDQKKRIGQVAEDIIAYSNVFGSTAT